MLHVTGESLCVAPEYIYIDEVVLWILIMIIAHKMVMFERINVRVGRFKM